MHTHLFTFIEPQKYVHHCHIIEHEDNDMMERMIGRALMRRGVIA